ncbi:hypothetical protein ACTD5D_21500 [Nocardia takedensis]|uniref:hypothetical protein n=1 Tax=Nocardia takedensis TaxID=259390 RepID=UPI003F76C945
MNLRKMLTASAILLAAGGIGVSTAQLAAAAPAPVAVASETQAGPVLRTISDEHINWDRVFNVLGSEQECWSVAFSYAGGRCAPVSNGTWVVIVD